MSKTSSEAKRRYNSKTYRRWSADLRFEEFEKIESLRGNLSRATFLKMLLESYKAEPQPNEIAEEAGE